MHLFISIFGLFIYQIYANSNYIPDYPDVKFCVIPDVHSLSMDPVKYLKRQLGLDRRCTHIRGSLYLEGLSRLENGTDPDLSFLESIVEISGTLVISSNSVRRIPLGNLKIIRGLSPANTVNALEISHNGVKGKHFLEELDLHSLRVIMDKNIRINLNPGLEYLVHKVDWTQMLLNTTHQKAVIQPLDNSRGNATYQCHSSCEYWKIGTGNSSQFCFGPKEQDCQQRTKCESTSGYIWCQFINGKEQPCDRQCAGGCDGNLPQNCATCRGVYKKDQCVRSCAPQQDTQFGNYGTAEDKLVYTSGGICTSQCPDSLLDQEKQCVYQCDFTKFYKLDNRCLECPHRKCYDQIGDQLMCDLRKMDPSYPINGRKYVIKKPILQQLTNCTTILGQLSLDDSSFNDGVTIPMLYEHFSKVREVIGDVHIYLLSTPVKNLTFLSNLREVRGTASKNVFSHGLKVFISSLEFLGLKRLEKVYGVVNFNHKSNLCYDNTIPWKEITLDESSDTKCNKTCHPLCIRGCWGPGNTMCYKCAFMEAGEYCVKSCSDATGYYTHSSENVSECRKCHPLCKDNCTGPSAGHCGSCLYAKENGMCVKSCSIGYYSVKSVTKGYIDCLPCHGTCYIGELLKVRNISIACSGPSNLIGDGGCSMCTKIIRKGSSVYCHNGVCPRGFFEAKIKQPLNRLSVEQLSCDPCHKLCSECHDGDRTRASCKHCLGFWSNDICVPVCIHKVQNVTREVKPGDSCPRCHQECRDGCQVENDNSKCNRCVNKKLFQDAYQHQFSCVTYCPNERNYTDYVAGDFVCLTYHETMYYQQRKRITMVLGGSLACLAVAVLVIGLLFRCRFQQSKIKAELKAFYSNFNEPNTKNIKESQVSRPPNMNRLQMIPISDLIFDTTAKPLGAGAFGKVFRGTWKVPGPNGKLVCLDVVVKVIHNSSKASTDEFLEEAQIMASVSHRHCLPLVGVCLSLEKPCLVSTFAKYGSLEKYLHQYGPKISSVALLRWSEQIADGMAYLNMRGIIHRDLAARNILVNDKEIVQITDFGLARLVDDAEDGIVVRSGRVPIRWLALETLLYANYSTASDIWAYGVTLWEIFTFGKRPYEELDTSKVKTYLQEGNRLYQPEICTLEVYMVMIKCWLEDPQMRPSFIELMSTFSQFVRNSKRYLCIPGELSHTYSSTHNSKKESICLQQLSMDSCGKQAPNFTNRSDDMSWNNATQNDSADHLINHSYNKDDIEDHAILPRRKKTKRNISFDKFKSFPKIGLTRFLSNKSHDSKTSQYFPSTSYEVNKNACLSYESTTALISHQRSFDNDGPPIHPQVAKLMKQESWQAAHPPKIVNKPEPMKPTERIFNDKDIKEEADRDLVNSVKRKADSRSPSLPPVDIARFVSHQPSVLQSTNDFDTKRGDHSPDSGNSQDFEIDDYMVPSRVQSSGYYNLTPSPSSTMKPSMDLNDATVMVHNDNYHQTVDDGYLEPTSKSTR